MLIRFRFANIRSFREEQELSLIAGPFKDKPEVVRHPDGFPEGILPAAVIYGANASGKTTVIRAARFLAAAVTASQRTWTPDGPIPREPFFLADEPNSEPSEVEADFLLANVRHRYGFRVDSEAVLEEWLYVYPNNKKQTWFHRQQGKPISFSSKMPGENRTIENLTRKNSLFLSAAAQNNHEALLPVYRWLSGLLFVMGDRGPYRMHTAQLCSAEATRNTIAQLLAVADLGVTDMEVRTKEHGPEFKQLAEALVTIFKLDEQKSQSLQNDKNQEIRLFHRFGGKAVPLELDQESAGTIAYLALLGPVVNALNLGVPLLIDELDASLHPLLASELIKLFNSPTTNPHGAQLICNTHDTNLLNTNLLRRDQIWFTEKSNTDATSHLFPLSDFKPRRAENIQTGYLQGRYGAIPFINSDSFLVQFQADKCPDGTSVTP